MFKCLHINLHESNVEAKLNTHWVPGGKVVGRMNVADRTVVTSSVDAGEASDVETISKSINYRFIHLPKLNDSLDRWKHFDWKVTNLNWETRGRSFPTGPPDLPRFLQYETGCPQTPFCQQGSLSLPLMWFDKFRHFNSTFRSLKENSE